MPKNHFPVKLVAHQEADVVNTNTFKMTIMLMLPTHWDAVKKIYAEGIATGNATFETTVPGWEEWDTAHMSTPRLVALLDDEVVGWAALTPVSGRCVYAGVAEVSVYVSQAARGKGVGKALLTNLVTESELVGLWTLQAGIFSDNTVSAKLHEACGFRLVGRRERIGKMTTWRDILFFEKRSNKTGIE